MFYLEGDELSDQRFDLVQACRLGLQETAKRMTRIPIPYFGAAAIGVLARRIKRHASRGADEERICDELAFVVRMQEEIGTGGAGFRYLFAAFLEEAARELKCAPLENEVSTMTHIGDQWRQFAVTVSQMCKGKIPVGHGVDAACAELFKIATAEADLFKRIGEATK